ncbi:hypothetical protein P9578_27590 [Brevibacillus choshinensis]|uniref:hypothetical protein n=1 Tax=Brevibacillus choshinensis TaxID=54911 RepID=UPI002E24806E|nr:hypothetical protein [Brevibacillus choshinensis]
MVESIVNKATKAPGAAGVAGKVIGLTVGTIDVKNDISPNLSKGSTNFGSQKSYGQSVVEAGTGAILTELGTSKLATAAAVTPAYSSLVPEQAKAGAVLFGLVSSYTITTADAKLGVSPAVAELTVKEGNRLKETGRTINEYMDRRNKKGYEDFSENEKKAIDKAIKNVTQQNERILNAKEKWIEADRKGDVVGKKAAEKEANEAREKGGRISKESSVDRVKELNEKIQKEKEKYRESEKIKDPVERQKVRDAAHDAANRYRSKGGTIR